jgi:hypothetical protein
MDIYFALDFTGITRFHEQRQLRHLSRANGAEQRRCILKAASSPEETKYKDRSKYLAPYKRLSTQLPTNGPPITLFYSGLALVLKTSSTVRNIRYIPTVHKERYNTTGTCIHTYILYIRSQTALVTFSAAPYPSSPWSLTPLLAFHPSLTAVTLLKSQMHRCSKAIASL